jgi:hypothetical protein
MQRGNADCIFPLHFPPQLKTQRVIVLAGLLSYVNKQILRHIILIGKVMKIMTILSKAPSTVNILHSG